MTNFHCLTKTLHTLQFLVCFNRVSIEGFSPELGKGHPTTCGTRGNDHGTTKRCIREDKPRPSMRHVAGREHHGKVQKE